VGEGEKKVFCLFLVLDAGVTGNRVFYENTSVAIGRNGKKLGFFVSRVSSGFLLQRIGLKPQPLKARN